MGARVVAVLLLFGSSACGVAVRPAFPPHPRPVPSDAPPIAKAMQWLEVTQVTPEEEATFGTDWAGDWPQWFRTSAVPLAPPVRDASPFLATFVHQALAHVRADTLEDLGLARPDLRRAERVRRRAIALMRRFARPGPLPGTDVYGFWPARRRFRTALERVAGRLALGVLGGPRLHGDLAPHNALLYPSALQIWPDLDTTSLIQVALGTAHALDGASVPATDLPALVATARDVGPPLRFPAWLASESGAYVTWFAPQGASSAPAPLEQDVDLAVNANVLFALGRAGRLDAEGAREATALLVDATAAGRHHPIEAVSDYYLEGFVYHYLVARAYADGPVPGLAPAAQLLAAEVEASASAEADGTVTWRGPHPPTAIACAVLTLHHTGRRPDFVAGGIRALERLQDPLHGDWGEAPFCRGESETGVRIVWTSRAFGVALALEALCRARSVGAPPGPALGRRLPRP